jgi:hypothetical protein
MKAPAASWGSAEVFLANPRRWGEGQGMAPLITPVCLKGSNEASEYRILALVRRPRLSSPLFGACRRN